tara:strand:+ start:478 stop:1062 length:585 start_codon:yes stop_codon:yes gene_type:complete
MGSRRLGRKRLYSLGKQGQSDTITAGANAPAVTNQTVRREGSKIITEISVDLKKSHGGDTVASNTTISRIIGKAGTEDLCSIATLDLATHGYITYAEIMCLEAPTTGVADIDIEIGTASTDDQAAVVTGTATLIEANSTLSVGERVGGITADVDSETKKYVYLVSGVGGTTGVYDAGKLLITLEGIASDAVPDA